MNIAELKIDLITQITNIKEKTRLEELMSLLKFQMEDSVYITTAGEREAIQEARIQISQGEIVSDEQFQNDIKEWLK